MHSNSSCRLYFSAELWAKPIIDIILQASDPKGCFEGLGTLGYVYKGEYNIPGYYGFNKREITWVNLHADETNHAEIELNLVFRDYLRTHRESRHVYEALKKELLARPTSHAKGEGMFRGYTLGKYDFIQKTLAQAGFNRRRILYCTHAEEWKAVKAMKAASESEEKPGLGWREDSHSVHIVWYLGGVITGRGGPNK